MVLYFGSLMYVYCEFSRQWSDFSYGEFPRILGEFIAIIHKKWSGSLEFSPVSSHVWFRRWQKTCGFQLNESPFFPECRMKLSEKSPARRVLVAHPPVSSVLSSCAGAVSFPLGANVAGFVGAACWLRSPVSGGASWDGFVPKWYLKTWKTDQMFQTGWLKWWVSPIRIAISLWYTHFRQPQMGQIPTNLGFTSSISWRSQKQGRPDRSQPSELN